jgi:L-amino acid N-acyltransferase YncA
MEITRAGASDYDGIIDLQSRCFIGNLACDERKDGFVSVEFPLPQIDAMASGLGIVVAREEGRVLGYMCASRLDFLPRPPVLDAMSHSLGGIVFQDKLLMDATTFVYGPVCIDSSLRGTGLLQRMFSALKTELAGCFQFGVAFVAADNHRSLRAHVNGLGMTRVGLFEHGGNKYYALAFSAR